MHNKFLTLCAILVEGFVAHEVLPIAQHKFGNQSGLVFVAFVSILIFYAWYAVFNGTKKLTRISALVLAVLVLVPMTVVSTYQSALLPEKLAQAAKSESALITLGQRQAEADKNYNQAIEAYQVQAVANQKAWSLQEKTRRESLAQINKEIKATKKAKQPDIYKALLKRQESLSKPYTSPKQQPQPEREIIKQVASSESSGSNTSVINLTAAQSVVMSALTPLFLWLASSLNPTKKKRSWFASWFTSFTRKRSSFTERSEQPSQVVNHSKVCLIQSQSVPVDAKGKVTTKAIGESFNVSDRQARKLKKEAVENGFLVKRNGFFYYPKNTASSTESRPQLKAVK